MADVLPVSREGGIASGGISSANHSAWLEQLESAQWQQRSRYQAQGEQARLLDHGERESSRAHAPRPPMQTEPITERERAGGQGSTAIRTMSGAMGAAVAQAVVTTGKSTPQVGNGMADMPLRPLKAGTDPSFMLQQQLRRQMNAQWQQQHVHLMETGEGARVWLRDARLEERDGYRLVHELRSQLARMGLRLAQFTLNGVPVSEAAKADFE